MVHAAVLSAKKVITSGLRRFEPFGGVSAGNHVGLDAKRRHKDVVNDVFGGHDQTDLAAHGNVQFVDLALPRSMLELPHPLLADDINFDSIPGRTVLVKVNLR